MVKARSPQGAEWVRESRSERSCGLVGGAGISSVTGRRAILGGNARRATKWDSGFDLSSTRVAPRSVFHASVPFWDGGFLLSCA